MSVCPEQVLQKQEQGAGAFSDADVRALEKLGEVFARALGQALKFEALHQAH
jgi:hypothetical protein